MPSTPTDFDDLDRALEGAAAEWLREQEAAMTKHPESEALMAYQEGRLAEEEAAEIRRHLVVCADCREDVEALARFDAADPADEPEEEETTVRAGWEDFQARRPLPAPTPIRRTGRSSFWMLAASLALAVVGLTSFFLPRDGASTPYVFDLVPDGTMIQRQAGTGPEIRVPAAFKRLGPRLSLGSPADFERFELSLTGEAVLRVDEVARDPEGRFTWVLPRDALPDGAYVLTLVGIDGDGRREELARYSFRLVQDP